VNLLIDEAMWPGLPLGRDDAGYEETVALLQREQMLSYLDEYYRPNSLVISVAGNIEHAKVLDMTERLFGDWQAQDHRGWAESFPPRDVLPVALIERETEQANICLATLGVAHSSPDYYAFILINAILGDGMSSRLFQTIREEQGLAYDIGSYFNSYHETGDLVVSAGVDPTQIEPAMRAIIGELDELRETPVPADELSRIKAYVRGSMLLGLEGTHQVASWLGGQETLRGSITDVDEMIERIDAVTAEDIQRVARACFVPEWRRLAVIGPYGAERAERLGELLKGKG
jgi:predicted Zn-dependent peptidase